MKAAQLSGWFAKRGTPAGYREYRPDGEMAGFIKPHPRGWWHWEVPGNPPKWGHVGTEESARKHVESLISGDSFSGSTDDT